MTQYHSDLPPEFQKLAEKLNSLKNFKGGGSGAVITIALGLLLVVGAFSSFYTIDPEEAGVVLRFGKYVAETSPGLHFKIPFGIDQVHKVKTRTIRKEEFGFRTASAGVVTRYQKGDHFKKESVMLSGDLNVADVEWIVQYQVNDPYKFLFNVRNVNANLRDVSESIMRLVVGNKSVNDILTTGKMAITVEVKKKMQEVYDHYGMGITITEVILQDVNPPEMVKDSFNEVNAAIQEQDKMVNQAWESYNKVIPEAKGKADQEITVAEGYALERINMAKGETNRFSAILKAYKTAPEVTRTRIYIEKMKDILEKVDNVYIMDPDAKSFLPHFDMKGGSK